MARRPRGIELGAGSRVQLERWIRSRSTPQGLARRCRIVLRLAEGSSVRNVAATERVSRHTVELWRDRFEDEGAEALILERLRARKPERKPEQGERR
jgi:transposase